MLAQMTVTDLDQVVAWYTRLFGAEPDARPMEGLAEWHLAEAFGVQVWADPGRAGRSAMVLDESDLDQRIRQLDRVGIAQVARRMPLLRGFCRCTIQTAIRSSLPANSARNNSPSPGRPVSISRMNSAISCGWSIGRK
jgi:hypothetical protein